jgi:hypothetical protein
MTRRTGPPAERRRRNGLHHPETSAMSEGFDPALSMMAALARCGVTDGLVRFSTGVEHWRDLADDLEQALAKA